MSNVENDNLVESSPIRVYVANLGKYNEGELVGAWLDLPQSRAKIDEFLRDTVGLTLDPEEAYAKGLRGERVYEEYAIHDFEFPQNMNGFTPNISEYASLDKVNVLACLIEQADEDCLEVMEAYQQNLAKFDIDEQISMLGHFVSGEYPDGVWRYDTEGFDSEEEAFGYYNVHELNPDLVKVLESQKIEGYFDYESYGRDCAMDGYLHDGIYIDGRSDIGDWTDDLTCEDVEENILVDHYDKGYFQSIAVKNLWDEREALGKEHGFELERDDDDYYYCRTFQPEEGKDINTIVAYDTDKQQWKAYTVDFNQPPDPRISEVIYRSDAAGAFAVGNSLYAEICEAALAKSWDNLDEEHFYQSFEVDGQKFERHVERDAEAQCWNAYVYDCQTQKTGDVSSYTTLEEAVRALGAGQQPVTMPERNFNARSAEEIYSPRKNINNRAASVAELAARGREKAVERNSQLQNDRMQNAHKRSR
jgi:antirestriction protein/L-rhamnose mutarotase